MNAGQFNKLITVQMYDHKESKWVDVCKIWAMVKTIKANEMYVAEKMVNESKVRFITRFTTKISPDMRILHRNEQFKIASIINDGMKNQTLTLHVYEMLLNDVCDLISVSEEIDSLGQSVGTEMKTACECSKAEIVQEESTDGGSISLRDKIMLIIESPNYNDENSLEYKGKKHHIYKVIDRMDGYTELYCEVRSGD